MLSLNKILGLLHNLLATIYNAFNIAWKMALTWIQEGFKVSFAFILAYLNQY